MAKPRNPPSRSQVLRILASLRDINIANSSLVFLHGDCDWDAKEFHYLDLRRYSALESNAIISYARPFVPSSKGTTIQFGYAQLKFTAKEQKIHEQVIQFRQKLIAHSDVDHMHFRVDLYDMGLGLESPANDMKFPHIQVDEGLHMNQKELSRFHDLVRKVQGSLNRAVIYLARDYPELVEGYVKPVAMR